MRQLGISPSVIDKVTARERVELRRRERTYRGERPPVDVTGHTIILVDDGLATGSTMRAAVMALPPQRPTGIVVAVPVAPVSTCDELEPLVDRLVCMIRPRRFLAVGVWYQDFTATSDQDVRALLQETPTATNPTAPVRRGRDG